MQVVELHDCFSTNEVISYEALGLCEEGKQLFLCHLCLLWADNVSFHSRSDLISLVSHHSFKYSRNGQL